MEKAKVMAETKFDFLYFHSRLLLLPPLVFPAAGSGRKTFSIQDLCSLCSERIIETFFWIAGQCWQSPLSCIGLEKIVT